SVEAVRQRKQTPNAQRSAKESLRAFNQLSTVSRRSEVRRQNSSLFGNGRLLSAQDIFLNFPRSCFGELREKLHALRTLEVRHVVTSVIAQLGFRRTSACF